MQHGETMQGIRSGTDALLHLNRKFEVSEVCNLPTGARNARPYRDGVLFNDTASDCVHYVGRDGCDRFVTGGSSPLMISLYDLQTNQKVGSVNLTMDIRNAIHGLEPWPYDD